MTGEEFEAQYAANSGITIARLRELGRIVAPCSCDYEGCEGWQSVNGEDWLAWQVLGLGDPKVAAKRAVAGIMQAADAAIARPTASQQASDEPPRT